MLNVSGVSRVLVHPPLYKPFQELWHINNLAQEKWEMQETGKSPARSEEIDKIFED